MPSEQRERGTSLQATRQLRTKVTKGVYSALNPGPIQKIIAAAGEKS